MSRKTAGFACLLLAMAPLLLAAAGEAGRYLSTAEFLDGAYPDGPPAARQLWVSGDLRDAVERAIGHRFGQLRVRYWYDGETSAWILEEIGKELPITIGIAVRDKAIDSVRILEFREIRGWEVRYPFFTDQFHAATLTDDGDLDRNIDGITGATLSVHAVKRMARAALLMHEEIDGQERE